MYDAVGMKMITATTPPYPPAPWRLRGGAWLGLFAADPPVTLPYGLQHVLPSRSAVVALLRYLQGTLQYDELMIGSLVRHGLRAGLHVDHIWVDDAQSLQGGRQIWGLPKELATFTWAGSTVQVADSAGPIVTLSVDPRTALLPRLPLALPFFGYRDNRWVYAIGSGSARLGRAGMRLSNWSDRFPYRVGPTPLLSIAMKPFCLSVPAPR